VRVCDQGAYRRDQRSPIRVLEVLLQVADLLLQLLDALLELPRALGGDAGGAGGEGEREDEGGAERLVHGSSVVDASVVDPAFLHKNILYKKAASKST